MRRAIVTVLGAVLLVAGAASPAPAEDEQPSSPFSFFDVTAQAQGATNYFFAVGEEINRIGSARVEAESSNVNSIAALVHRGLVVGYAYGATLGRSAAGGSGIAPDFPGEIQARHPAEPNEVSWQGPANTAKDSPLLIGSEYAKSTESGGLSNVLIQAVQIPGQLSLQNGAMSSIGGVTPDGVQAEAISTVEGITIGGVVKIERLVTTARGIIPAGGDKPHGEGSTIAEGVTINGTPLRITGAGLEAGGHGQGKEQKGQLSDSIRKALASANIEDIRLVETAVTPGEDGQSLTVRSGGIRVIFRSNKVRDATPQAIAGGGLEVGGSSISVLGKRSQ